MVLNDDQLTRLKKFVVDHIGDYNPKTQLFWQFEYSPKKDYPYDFVNQIYTYLFPDYIYYKYKDFIDYLKEKFPNLRTYQILEIASGYLPAISLTLRKMMDIDKPITCMDPTAIDLPLEGITNKKAIFSLDTDVSEADLLIAHWPCESLDAIVDSTIKNQKELCVQTCPCGHNFYTLNEYKYYTDSLTDKLRVMEDKGFIVESDIIEDDNIKSPVISVRKRIK